MTSHPFMSAEEYRVIQIIGFMLSALFSTLLFIVNLTRQVSRIEQRNNKQDEAMQHTEGIYEDQYTSSKAPEDQSRMPTHPVINLYFPPLLITLCLVLICVGVAKLSFLVLFLGICMSIMTACYLSEPISSDSTNFISTRAMHSVALTAVSGLLAGSISLIVYASAMIPLANISYLGPMRIVGFSNTIAYNHVIETHTSSAACVSASNIGLIQVAWGGEWGCPGNMDKECLAYVDSFFCDTTICNGCYQSCSNQDFQTAKEKSQSCLETRYQTTMALIDSGADYDPNVAPDKDDSNHWQYHTMYGDCSTCKAQFDFVFNVNHAQVKIGRLNTVMYYSFGCAFALQWVRMWLRHRQTSQDSLILSANKTGVST